MSHSEDRWQLSWLPLPLKKSVLKSFHDIDRQTSIDLYISLGTVPDHELAAVLGVDSMTVTRLRQAFGIPVLLTSYIPIEIGPDAHVGPTEMPWPWEMPTPPRRTCVSCSNWGPEDDPDYDECRLAGDELLQANAWYIAAGGFEGNPPHSHTTGCPHWDRTIDWSIHDR